MTPLSLSLDDLYLGDLHDPRTKLVVRLLSSRVYGEGNVTAALRAAGLSPANYEIGRARRTWLAAVPDAARERKLDALVGYVAADDATFGRELERELQALHAPSGGGAWYRCEDPFRCGFVGAGASRAMIDRTELRRGLADLAHDEYRALVVSGGPGSGKTHSWLLIDHLRETGKLTGHKCIRVTTHTWGNAEVTGEMVAQSVADRLGLDIRVTASGELPDARARKILDMIVGQYPADGVIRWIVLDGLDRPRVAESARDVGRQLLTMVIEGDLPNTRLVITGFDELGVINRNIVQVEKIRAIDADLVRSFLMDVASHLGQEVEPEDLDDLVEGVLGTGAPGSRAPGAEDPARSLADIEVAAVALVKERWGAAIYHGG
jgi:hypothetical protein